MYIYISCKDHKTYTIILPTILSNSSDSQRAKEPKSQSCQQPTATDPKTSVLRQSFGSVCIEVSNGLYAAVSSDNQDTDTHTYTCISGHKPTKMLRLRRDIRNL